MNLSKRLYAIYQFVPKGAVVADVGADHGKLIISLVKDGIIPFGYAIENKSGPYKRLFSNIKQEGLFDKITPVLDDGIHNLDPKVDTLVLAGMGGLLISDILKKYPENLKNIENIICDAHTANDEMRRAIVSLGYRIKKEMMVFEDKIYYEIIHFVKGKDNYSDDDYAFGPILRIEQGDLYEEKWKKRAAKIEELLEQDIGSDRKKELLKEREMILRNL